MQARSGESPGPDAALRGYAIARKQQVSRRRFEFREALERLKDGPCKDCRRKFHPCQVDLVRPDGGGRPISSLIGKSLDRLFREAAVRVILCANCNRLRVWRRQRKMRAGPT